jgi:pimeloyl-ACP methyl ester carboxylesterase
VTVHSVRQDADGQWTLRYDPAIADTFSGAPPGDVSLWSFWDRIDCPVLVLRGTESDVLLASTAEEMTRRGPRAQLVELAGIGHAPALMEVDQIEPIRRFLSLP